MTPEGNLEYAAARVQAQHGRLPSEADWQGLEASQDYAHYLDSARGGPLAAWVSALDGSQNARPDVHALERSLRREWVSHVERVASWHPRPWQPWLKWLAWLPSLPLLPRQAHQPPEPPAWLLPDPVVGPVARQAAAAHGAAPPLPAALRVTSTAARPGSAALAAAWRARWDALAPQSDADTRTHLNRLRRALDRYAQALPAARNTPALRREWVERLEVLFRLSAGTAIASACHLGRLALELERLRGGLASRALLGPVAAAGAAP